MAEGAEILFHRVNPRDLKPEVLTPRWRPLASGPRVIPPHTQRVTLPWPTPATALPTQGCGSAAQIQGQGRTNSFQCRLGGAPSARLLRTAGVCTAQPPGVHLTLCSLSWQGQLEASELRLMTSSRSSGTDLFFQNANENHEERGRYSCECLIHCHYGHNIT